ncbi:MAG: putative copper-exporting P-type ATPase B [Parcubacteria group bacterium Gr01-1014_2]|nr:MAG: putative copper-exporting P-type ATPase B [Parcubacteria group bacterium Gr01-1014_2]
MKHEVHKKQNKHTGHSAELFLKKFWVSLILTAPVIIFSSSRFIPLILGSIVFFYGGWIFIRGAIGELKARLPGMMTLIGLAISTAYFYSIGVVVLSGPAFVEATAGKETLFWELTTLITVMLLGHWFEMRAVSSAQGALRELSKLLPDEAEIILANSQFPISNFQTNPKLQIQNTKIIPISELKAGDVVFVRPGARIPADGEVVEGKSEVNESMITGESAPVSKDIASRVIAGTINGDGSLKVKVSAVGARTFLAGVMRLVKEAQASKSRLQVLSDRAAFYLTVIAILSGSFTFLIWFLAEAGFGFALERLVAVLVIACPHALGLAVPLVAAISTGMAARNGVLVKQRLALEVARKINTVIFDKTGTLTKGEYGVTDIIQNAKLKNQNDNSKFKIDESEILRLAASVDSHSEHFVAKAIVNEAGKRELKLAEVQNFQRIPGQGVRGKIHTNKLENVGMLHKEEVEVMVGGESMVIENHILVPSEIETKIEVLSNQGKTTIYVTADSRLLGVIALADTIRDESRESVKKLKELGVKVAMLTGDSEKVARWVAGEMGIDEYFARVLPHQKSEKVKMLQQKGQKIAMVGDGINDAPALAQADLGIAIGAGTNVAIESAGIILVKNDPRDIVKIIKLSKLTYSKMIQNLFWATGYNIVALPLAAGVLYSRGVVLEPAIAALFMSLSTVIVAVNAVLLRKRKL